jgi:hypothetical protein
MQEETSRMCDYVCMYVYIYNVYIIYIYIQYTHIYVYVCTYHTYILVQFYEGLDKLKDLQDQLQNYDTELSNIVILV